jgi:hypothetical protein
MTVVSRDRAGPVVPLPCLRARLPCVHANFHALIVAGGSQLNDVVSSFSVLSMVSTCVMHACLISLVVAPVSRPRF